MGGRGRWAAWRRSRLQRVCTTIISRMTCNAPRLFRVIVPVSDLETAAGFYSRLLGLEGRSVGGGRQYFDCGPVILAVLRVLPACLRIAPALLPACAAEPPRPLPERGIVNLTACAKLLALLR